jgi:hypothetical protein
LDLIQRLHRIIIKRSGIQTLWVFQKKCDDHDESIPDTTTQCSHSSVYVHYGQKDIVEGRAWTPSLKNSWNHLKIIINLSYHSFISVINQVYFLSVIMYSLMTLIHITVNLILK